MPLAFGSLSHGSIAFGFFNVESDMLLCDRYFFFADKFCAYIDYVWRGGYPRWKDEIRPAYVSAMRDKIMRKRQGIFV